MKIFKRYRNRRLYDTDEKRTVTLDDLAAMMRRDREFTVIENATGENVTTGVITQIILKELKKDIYNPVIPRLGKALIQHGGENVMNVFKKSLLAGLGIVHEGKERLQEIVDELVEQGEVQEHDKAALLKELKERVKAGSTELKQSIEKMVDEAMTKVNRGATAEARKMAKEIERLHARIAVLEKEKAAAAKNAGKPAKKKASVKKKTTKKKLSSTGRLQPPAKKAAEKKPVKKKTAKKKTAKKKTVKKKA